MKKIAIPAKNGRLAAPISALPAIQLSNVDTCHLYGNTVTPSLMSRDITGMAGE